jgi:hypothetical protein
LCLLRRLAPRIAVLAQVLDGLAQRRDQNGVSTRAVTVVPCATGVPSRPLSKSDHPPRSPAGLPPSTYFKLSIPERREAVKELSCEGPREIAERKRDAFLVRANEANAQFGTVLPRGTRAS